MRVSNLQIVTQPTFRFFGPDDLQKTEDILERICQVSDSGFLFQQDRAGAALCLILRRTIRML